ncbi:FxSxx-COOH system tetratricopeptide repeat protein [Streptomyces sp. NBC_01198]|uniref:FxSxx-COOH system tetratricopeptide repeat protein n=1 Tax=Streptomyces sp. NBC_01198 TaxID=2903769 RepID=UPI002E0F11FC|nr:FxSxx-COOH system tetratricopeptide repeat protein [Streptomyces sp. NBC_01198]
MDHAPYDRMWATWIAESAGPGIDALLRSDTDRLPPGLQEPGCWTLVLLSATRAGQQRTTQPEPVWAGTDDQLAASRTVIVRVDRDPLPGLRAVEHLIDLSGADASRAGEILREALHRLGIATATAAEPPAPGHPATPDPGSPHPAPFPADRPVLCRLPPADRTFVGRDDLLARIHRSLVADTAPAGPRGVCLWGLGGVGKTSLALEYAHRFHHYYETIWWVRAETAADLRADLADLAAELGVRGDPDMPVMLRELLHVLARSQDVLLILDNAEPDAQLREVWPHSSGVHLLITSRQPDWADLLRARDRMEVPLPSESAATDMLLAASEGPPAREARAAAAAIAEQLGRLPLALSHVAAYVRQSGTTLQQFDELLGTSRARLLTRYRPDPASHPVALTWELSLRRSDQETPGARELMKLCATLAPDDIPRRMLHEHASAVSGALTPVLGDALAFDAAVRSLVKYSLVKAAPDSLQLHRLVQDAVLADLDAEEAAGWLADAAALVLAALPQHVDDPDQWPDCDRLTTHAAVLVARAARLPAAGLAAGTSHAVRARISVLALRCGEYQLERGNFSTADALFQTAVDLARETSGGSSASFITAAARHALARYRLADLPAARSTAESAVAACSEGTDTAAQILAFHTLSRVLVEFSELDEAYRHAEHAHHLLRDAPASTVMAVGEGTPMVERTLAVIQWRRGDYRDAVRWIRSADAHWDAAGARRPRFEPMELAFAELLGDQDLIRAVGERAERSIDELEQQVGPDHRDLVGRKQLAAEAAVLLGQHAKARRLLQECVEGLRRSHGPEHPSTAWAERSLGSVLCRAGDRAEGLSLLRHALAVYESDYGAAHPYAAEGMASLGAAELACGLRDEAERHLREAWRINELAYGPVHPKLAFVFDDLAALLAEGDPRSAEAAALAARAAAIRADA